jgi:molecular chaperone GrpE (heat shock protein)
MSYFSDLLNALLGKARSAGVGPESRAQAAALEMDLRERDARIAAMQKEYAALQSDSKRAAAGAGEEQLRQVFKKLAAPLSNIAALAAMAEAGLEVEVRDFATLFRGIEKQLKSAGLEPVGVVGESVPFDAANHQRMGGPEISQGTLVTVRTPGYRYAGQALLKAMVAGKESAHG